MDYHLDLTLRPDPEFSAPILMNALFSKLHRVLVNLKADDIGISFPEHKNRPRSLGNVLRMHGTLDRLTQLMQSDWLSGMHDHSLVGEISKVPATAKHRRVRRVQPKTNAERLRRRHEKRHAVSKETAQKRIPKSIEQKVSLPFVTIRSRSTGQVYCLFVEHGSIQNEAEEGVFSAYGLSTTATVPWF